MLANTPSPPYYAVIFSSVKTKKDGEQYEETAQQMLDLAQIQSGFLGVESARETLGITVSYWESLEAIRAWRQRAEHRMAQTKGKHDWYQYYTVRIARVEKEYSFFRDKSLKGDGY